MPTTLNIYGEMQEINIHGRRAVIQAQVVRPGTTRTRHEILWSKNSWNWAELSRELEAAAHEQIGRLEADGRYWVVYKRFWQTVPMNGESQVPLLPRQRPDGNWQDQAHAYTSSFTSEFLESVRAATPVYQPGPYEELDLQPDPWISPPGLDIAALSAERESRIAMRERIRRMEEARRAR